MESTILTYSESKQHKLAWLFLLLGFIGTVVAIHQWLYADPIFLSIVVGGIGIGVIGVVLFLKLRLAPKKKDQIAIRISSNGIEASTTPVAKGAGLIAWQDVADLQIYNKELSVLVNNPGKYAARMKNYFVRDTFKASKGQIRISFAEVDTSPENLAALIKKFTDTTR